MFSDLTTSSIFSSADFNVRFVRSGRGRLLSFSFCLASSSVLSQTSEEHVGGSMGAGFVGSFAACASTLTGAGLSLVMGSDDT